MNKKRIIALVGLISWVVGAILVAVGFGVSNVPVTLIGVILCYYYGFLRTLKIVIGTWRDTIVRTVKNCRGFVSKLFGLFLSIVVGALVAVVIGVVVCPFISIRFSILHLKK
jgi:hypothetical protein